MAQVATLGECKPWFWSAQSSGFAIYLLIYVRPTSDKNALKQYTWQSVNMTTSDIIGGTNFTPLDLFKMLTHFGHFTPSIRHAYSRYEHSQRQKYWRKGYVSANILVLTYLYLE